MQEIMPEGLSSQWASHLSGDGFLRGKECTFFMSHCTVGSELGTLKVEFGKRFAHNYTVLGESIQ